LTNFDTDLPTYAGGEDQPEWCAFAKRFKELADGDYSKEGTPAKHCAKNVWIVKPAHLNQGRGIQVFHKLGDIKRFLSSGGWVGGWV
jgi:hypothetical protein